MKKVQGRRRKRSAGKLYLFLMMGFMAVVLVTQLVLLYQKSEAYAAREAQLVEELHEQEDRRQELADYEQYTKSEEYTRNTAKSKLGLVSPNEIIFRER